MVGRTRGKSGFLFVLVVMLMALLPLSAFAASKDMVVKVKPGVVSGTVCRITGETMPNVEITVTGKEGPIAAIRTDKDGSFKISPLPAGQYAMNLGNGNSFKFEATADADLAMMDIVVPSRPYSAGKILLPEEDDAPIIVAGKILLGVTLAGVAIWGISEIVSDDDGNTTETITVENPEDLTTEDLEVVRRDRRQRDDDRIVIIPCP